MQTSAFYFCFIVNKNSLKKSSSFLNPQRPHVCCLFSAPPLHCAPLPVLDTSPPLTLTSILVLAPTPRPLALSAPPPLILRFRFLVRSRIDFSDL